MKFPKLYKMSSTGKVSQWKVIAYDDHYEIIHGYIDGRQQSKIVYIHSGKNIGKINETTIKEQCQLEAESRWNKQKDRKGYGETIPTKKQLRPMLAKSYNRPFGTDLTDLKDGKHIIFPCFWQPKSDGMRCLAIKKEKIYLFTRQGKPITILSHITDELNKFMEDDDIWDGELYTHGMEFQKIISAIKRDNPSKDTSSIHYHVYDCVRADDFEDRFQYLFSKLLKKKEPVSDIIKLVWTQEINSADELKEIHQSQTKRRGYEGIMLRNKKGGYEIDKRSKNLQKVKVFCEEEFEIVGAYENSKKPGTCTFQCKTKKGAIFGCMPKGTEEDRAQYWEDWQNEIIKYGDLLTVMFFSWTTSDNPVPRFPVGKAIRNYD
jgi:ATP-dependent DNA ligase